MTQKNIIHRILLLPLLFSTLTALGVDVTLKLHYNNYPLCNWEVELKHNDAHIGTAVTDSLGIAVFEGVYLPSRKVDAFLYHRPRSEDGRWNAQGFIHLEDDYSGELDFGPIVADKDAPKSKLEDAWGITLYDCSDLPDDFSTTPSTTRGSVETTRRETPERRGPDPVEEDVLDERDMRIEVEEIKQIDYQKRIDSLKKEKADIVATLKELNDSGPPEHTQENKIYQAMLEELEAHQEWVEKQLKLVQLRADGKNTGGLPDEVKALKDRYTSARTQRQEIQHKARKQVVEEKDELGGTDRFERRLEKLQHDLALKKKALETEEESLTPDSKRIAQLKGEIEKIRRKIRDLVE